MDQLFVEDYDTTILIPPKFTALVDGYLNLKILRC